MLAKILPQIYPLTKYHVILANGQFPTQPYLIEILSNAQSIICCDGAVNKLLKHNLQPNYIIGDCDSIDATTKAQYINKIVLLPDQNSNDLTKALNFAKFNLNLENVIILGATGSREDHTLGNIAILAEFTPLFANLALISDHGIFTAHLGNSVINTIPGQQISFFTMNPDNIINCDNLKWPLTNFKLHNWHHGTLNQATATIINLQTLASTIIYRAFEVKL